MANLAYTIIAVFMTLSIFRAHAGPLELELDLNAATASLKLDKPSSSGGLAPSSTTILTMMIVTSVVGGLAALIALLLQSHGELAKNLVSQATYHKIYTQIRSAMTQCLFYALSALTRDGMQVRSPIPKHKRTTFSLDAGIKLDACHLSLDDRRRRSLGSMGEMGASSMMAAVLEPPMIDLLSVTPKHMSTGSRQRRTSTSSYRRSASRQASCNPSPRQGAASPAKGMTTLERMVEQQQQQQVTNKGPATAMTGRKPDLRRLREMQERLKEVKTRPSEVDEEWETDSDWETEIRADTPETGHEMDGLDVGCIPSRVLELPRPALPTLATGVYGRSIFTSDFPIPRVGEV